MSSIIKSGLVRCAEHAERDAPASREGAPPAPPDWQVRLISLEGRAQAIEVRCACGETTVIELEFPPPAEAGGEGVDPS